jgi:iron uptake system component EfeO
MTRRISLSAAAVLVTALLAGCGGSSGRPAADAAPKAAATKLKGVRIALSAGGCVTRQVSVPSGLTTFHVANHGARGLSEFELKDLNGIVLGEREFLLPGRQASFTLDLYPGTYVLNCPNSDRENNGRLTVTGRRIQRVRQPGDHLLLQAVTGYDAYVQKQAVRLLGGTREFAAALERGDLAKAKDLYGPVRFYFELIEPVAESFGDLDPRIDARVNDVVSAAEWTGFHRIERTLWVDNTTRGTEKYGRQLLADMQTLIRRLRTITFQPAQMANGAVGLLNEVANSKITGEEDRYSHTDLSDFAANLAGAEVAFDLLRPALVARGKRAIANTIAKRFAAVQKGLSVYRRDTTLGFALYNELTARDRRRFAAQIDALAEPLSTLAVLLPNVSTHATGRVRIATTLHGAPEGEGVRVSPEGQRAEVSMWPARGEVCWEIYTVATGVTRPLYAQIRDWRGRPVLTIAKPWAYESCGRAKPATLRAIAGHPHNYVIVVHSELHPKGAVRGRF